MNRGVPARKQPWLQSVPTKFRPAKTNHLETSNGGGSLCIHLMILWVDHINGVALVTTCSQNVPNILQQCQVQLRTFFANQHVVSLKMFYIGLWMGQTWSNILTRKRWSVSAPKNPQHFGAEHMPESRARVCVLHLAGKLWEWMTTRHGETARHGSFHGAYIIQHKSPMEISSLLLQEKHDHTWSQSIGFTVPLRFPGVVSPKSWSSA